MIACMIFPSQILFCTAFLPSLDGRGLGEGEKLCSPSPQPSPTEGRGGMTTILCAVVRCHNQCKRFSSPPLMRGAWGRVDHRGEREQGNQFFGPS